MRIIDMSCKKSTKCSNCDGVALSFEVNKEVSKKRIRKIWKTITNKPFPSKLHAYILQSEEYERMMQALESCQLIKIQSMFEYREKFNSSEAEAVVLRTDLSEYWILIKKNTQHSSKKNLRHELENIAKREEKSYSEIKRTN